MLVIVKKIQAEGLDVFSKNLTGSSGDAGEQLATIALD